MELRCTDIDVNEYWLSYLDFRDYDAYRKDVVDFAPDYLFHLGAFTDLEYCECTQRDLRHQHDGGGECCLHRQRARHTASVY